MDDVERKQVWYGHVQRMNGNRFSKQVIEWIPLGQRKKERPKRKYERR